ncbi:MAG: 3-oxoacyl-[acyl-carrier-protein] reductase [Bacteroidetes bacterium]|nr:3-oxoacyl-[acyl-carrier-protein] reductase [Bacteroidota bacterium]
MNPDFSGKNVLVTGGARGIGRSIVEAFAGAGANIAFTDISVEVVTALEEELKSSGVTALALPGDAVNPDEAAAAVETVVNDWGSIDVLVNNVGITRDALMLRMSVEDWDAVINTNLRSVFNFCKAVYLQMMRQRRGSIVNISSVVGVMGNAGQTNYSASKAGIIGFTKSLAKELGARGVTVNAVAPGFIETEMTAKLSAAARDAMLGAVPMVRPGTPDDVASAVLFLASEAATYITGHVLHVDGGLTM